MANDESGVQWNAFGDIAQFSPAQGIAMRSLTGTQIMLNMVTIEPGAVVPIHSHPNEQAGYVLRGKLVLTIGGETRTLVPGDCYVAPADVPHGATTDGEGCEVLDVFSPPRPDYIEAAAKARSEGKR
jgi:quercetin dioxygenase-like cupin family protein